MPPYKVIFIDWNGTLSGEKFWRHLEQRDPPLFAAIEGAMFGELRPLLKPWMRGALSAESVLIDDSDDKDGVIAGFGVDYVRIEPVRGLVPALQQLTTP